MRFCREPHPMTRLRPSPNSNRVWAHFAFKAIVVAATTLGGGCVTGFPEYREPNPAANQRPRNSDVSVVDASPELDAKPSVADGGRTDADPALGDSGGVPPDGALDGRLDALAADTTLRDAAPPPDDRVMPDARPPDATPCTPGPEICNGLDDDCDGETDEERVCGVYVAAYCQVWLGWADRLAGPGPASPSWGECPPSERAMTGDVRCVATRGDLTFRTLDLDGDVNHDDQLGVAFSCDDPNQPTVAHWIESHCALFLGHADADAGPDSSPTWGPCPSASEGEANGLRCTSSGYDGRFRPMTLVNDVDADDSLGVAFICRSDEQPSRARHIAEAVEVYLGWEEIALIPDGWSGWDLCPRQGRDMDGIQRCVGTFGDQQFHRLDLEGDVDGWDQLGIALLPSRP